MTKEQKVKFDAIVATGRLNEEQIEKLRAGFERKPQKIDIKKSKLHFDKAMRCMQLEKIDPEIIVDWIPEDDDGDAYIQIAVPDSYAVAGKAKSIILDALSSADSFSCVRISNAEKILITLGFLGIIEDPNKPDNITAN